MAWTNKKQPFGPNHAPLLTGTSVSDGITAVPVAVDDATGRLLVSATGGGGGGGTEYTNGTVVPSPIGTVELGYDGTNVRAVTVDTSGNQRVVGNVDASTTDSGSPVKTGGKYTTTKPTYTNGQRTDTQTDSRGNTQVTLFLNDSGQSITALADNTDGISASGLQRNLAVQNRNTVFNGTTWDRMPGDAVNGVKVQGTFSSTPTSDITPATQNITAADTNTVTVQVSNNQSMTTGTPTAGSAASFTLNSLETIFVQVTGSFVGTVIAEGSADGGVTWFTKAIKQTGTNYKTSNFTNNFAGNVNVATLTNFRIRATSFTSGPITVLIRQSINNHSVYVANDATLSDGVTQSVKASIKPASTAPLTTDTSLVTTTSPNSPDAISLAAIATNLPAKGQTTMSASQPVAIASDQSAVPISRLDIPFTGSVSANATTFAPITLNGANTLSYQVTGTFVASFVLQLSTDGTTFTNLTSNASQYNSITGLTVVPSISTTGNQYRINVTGFRAARFITTAYTSGTVTVTGQASYAVPTAIDGVVLTSQQGALSATVTSANSLTTGTVTTASTTVTGSTNFNGGGYGAVLVQGTYAGVSFNVQISGDSGTTYSNCYVYDSSANQWLAPGATITPGTNATKTYYFPLYAQATGMKLTSTAYTSGTMNVRWSVGQNILPGSTMTQDNSTGLTGATVPGSATYIALNNSAGNLAGLRGLSNNNDAVSVSGTGDILRVWAEQVVFNGTNFDRVRNNSTGVLVAAGATATASNVALTTYNAGRLMLLVNIASGAGTVTVAINGTSVSGYSTNLLTSTALTGVGTTALRIFDGATPSANLVANDLLPRNLSITATVSGTIAYGIDWILAV